VKIGANYLGAGKCEFTVWAPFFYELALEITAPQHKLIPMRKDDLGYWQVFVEGVERGTQYFYKLNEEKIRPDPASFFQPEGVHRASEVISHNFVWHDQNWQEILLKDMLIYELHIGTFTQQGTFLAVIDRLDALVDLGINTLEIMPVAQFPGQRNWGYDGVYAFAVQNFYGGPLGLKELVNACHSRGIAVILDVVYNHLGPEGNYLSDFGPYFTDKYKSPWGQAINFDGQYSYGVRNFFIENALYWLKNYHLDGLRLDAVHSIFDFSAKHILLELSQKVEELGLALGRKIYLIAESDLNDTRILKPEAQGGCAISAQWCDDFHHCLHTLLTKEDNGYYSDFGSIDKMVKALKQGFVYTGEYSKYRKNFYGNSAKGLSPEKFVVFSQNHDQAGNRREGERLSNLVSFSALKLAAATIILSPYVPLIFMGQEYGEDNPFLYFVSHSDAQLISAVRQGRKKEFSGFKWQNEPPDPQAEETFSRSKIEWEKRDKQQNNVLLKLYKQLINFRKTLPALKYSSKKDMDVFGDNNQKLIFLKRQYAEDTVFVLLNFNQKESMLDFDSLGCEWQKIIDSAEKKWLGSGSSLPDDIKSNCQLQIMRLSFAVYLKKDRV